MSKYDDMTDKQLEKENQRLQREQTNLQSEKAKIKAITDKRHQDERIKQALEDAGVSKPGDVLIEAVAAEVVGGKN